MTTTSDIERLIRDSEQKSVFSYKELVQIYHFTQHEVKNAEGYITRTSRGYYQIEKALKIEFLLSLFLNNINQRNYEEALITLSKILDTSYQKNDYNCYLYLLGQIIELPENYRRYIDELELSDIQDSSKPEYGIVYSNIFRLNIATAHIHFTSNILTKQQSTLHDRIMKALLDPAYKKAKDFENQIREYSSEGDYQLLKIAIEKRKKRHKISLSKEETLTLVKLLEAINRFRVIPMETVPKSNAFNDVLMSGNLEKVREIIKKPDNTSIIPYVNISPTTNRPVQLRIINRVIDSVDELKKSAYTRGEILLKCPIELMMFFMDIVDMILDCEMQKAYNILKDYLKEKNKEKYFDIIVELFRLAIKDEDYTFYGPLKGLVIIMSRNPSLDALKKYLYDKPDRNKNYAYIPTRKYTKKTDG